jgi:Putative MetA-pathway of phenol degradation
MAREKHQGENVKMTRQKFTRAVGAVVAFGWLAAPALAQTAAATAAQPSGDQSQSAAALAQQATNPFSASWLLQVQQNNTTIDMPSGHENRTQSNLLFQPLMSVSLNKDWGLYIRPVVTTVNSIPLLGPTGSSERTAGFGDTVLGIAAAHTPLFGGRLVIGAGPTFIFPTASQRELGQDTWQFGPDAGVTLLGRHFIAYGFVQQWFKVGGSGSDTNQMNGVFNYTYSFPSGWTIGTQPTLSVDWKADGDNGKTFAIGPQVGKLCKCGHTPTLVQLQLAYYAVRPDFAAPKWAIQLQVTPTIPALIKKTLF